MYDNRDNTSPDISAFPTISFLTYPTQMYKYDYEYDNEIGNGTNQLNSEIPISMDPSCCKYIYNTITYFCRRFVYI